MSSIGSAIFTILIIAVLIGYKIIEYYADKTAIQESLEKKKSQIISISKNWLDFDRSTGTYNVSYKDTNGKQYKRECKFHYADLYWDDENEQLLSVASKYSTTVFFPFQFQLFGIPPL